MFLDILKFTVENNKKKLFRENCFEIWSQKNTFREEEKIQKNLLNKLKFLQSLEDSGDKTSSFLKISETKFSIQFSQNNLFLSSTLSMPKKKTRLNDVTKCVTAKIYHMKVLILESIFF